LARSVAPLWACACLEGDAKPEQTGEVIVGALETHQPIVDLTVLSQSASVQPTEAHELSQLVARADVRLRAMLEQYFRLVWRTLRRLGIAEANAEDAAQQVFIIASNRLERIAPGKERAFLLGTASRVASNLRRSAAIRHEVREEAISDEPEDPAPDLESLVDLRTARRMLDRILERMPFDLRVVFVFFEIDGLSTPEIAQLMGVAVGTVASRLRRAREQFAADVAELRLDLEQTEGRHG